jgi:site-specific recombinase XerD
LKIKRHAASGLFSFKQPARYSTDNKRKELYFKTERKAQEKRAEIEEQYREHRTVVSPDDHAAVRIINAKYGGFRRALTALDHYEKNVAKIRSISVKDSVEQYIKRRQTEKKPTGEPRWDASTIANIKSRLGSFANFILANSGNIPLDQVPARDIDAFLATKGDFRSFWKDISPFFDFASMQDWILKNPLEKLNMPDWNEAPREIYTPEQYSKLLIAARDAGDEEVLRLLVLNGVGFLRFEEIVRKTKNDQVLLWEDLQLDRNFINVRAGVAKSTRRVAGDARQIPTPATKSLYKWLHQHKDGRSLTGRIIPFSEGYFRRGRLNKIYKAAGVKQVHNGLRHSCISYYLAMYPKEGVTEVAKWSGNTEATARKHYIVDVRPEEGAAWFAAVDQLVRA